MPRVDPEKRRAYEKGRQESRRAYMKEWRRQRRLTHGDSIDESSKRWKEDNRELYLTALRNRKVVQRYNWSEGDNYDLMLERQGGHCADCQAQESRNGRSLQVDHDHHTGVIRGIVCRLCNSRRRVEDDKRKAAITAR